MSSNPARRQLPGRISDDDCDCRPDGRQSVWKVCRGVGLLSLALGQILPVNTKEGASRWMLAQPPARHLQPTICLLKPPCLAQRDTSRGNLSETPDFGCPWRLMVKFGYQRPIRWRVSPGAPIRPVCSFSLYCWVPSQPRLAMLATSSTCRCLLHHPPVTPSSTTVAPSGAGVQPLVDRKRRWCSLTARLRWFNLRLERWALRGLCYCPSSFLRAPRCSI